MRKRDPVPTMIGGVILAVWIPFWNFLSALSTIDFMRTSGGHAGVGTFFLPRGIADGLTVLGIGVMAYAFVQLAARYNGAQPDDESQTQDDGKSPTEDLTSLLLFKTTTVTLPDGRQIINCTTEDLQAVYRANTIDQTNRILCENWVKLSGKLNENYGSGFVVLEYDSPPVIALRFEKDWFEPLSVLRPGSSMTIRGKITGRS